MLWWLVAPAEACIESHSGVSWGNALCREVGGFGIVGAAHTIQMKHKFLIHLRMLLQAVWDCRRKIFEVRALVLPKAVREMDVLSAA